jgi:hypothetical protein
VLEAQAQFDGPQRKVAVRLAEQDGLILARSSTRPRMAYRCCRRSASGGCRAWLTSRSGSQPAKRDFTPRPPLKPLISNNRRDAIENIVEADPVAARVREIIADRAQWAGSASDLLLAGANVAGNPLVGNRSGWPKNPRALAGRLRRAQTFLRTLGIEIVFGREGRLGTRTIRITAMGENRTHDTVSTVSRVSDHGDRAGLNHPPPGLEQAL